MRNETKYGLPQNTIQGKVNGKRGPGRRSISWLANLRKSYGATATVLFSCAVNEVGIAMMIVND